jgi:hypothetical protein
MLDWVEGYTGSGLGARLRVGSGPSQQPVQATFTHSSQLSKVMVSGWEKASQMNLNLGSLWLQGD